MTNYGPLAQRKPGQSMTEFVMEYVRGRILSGEMNTNEWYSVYRLSDELDISRSPCRDALLRLEEIGLIQFTKNRGFRVLETTPEDVAQDFAIRLGIEPQAAYRAATFRTQAELDRLHSVQQSLINAAENNEMQVFFEWDLALHDLILLAGKSARGRRIIDQIRNASRLLGVGTSPGMRSLMDICEEHEPIIQAIAAGNADEAANLMANHLVSSGCLLVRQSLERGDKENLMSTQELNERTAEIWNEHTLGY
ncbi:MAG: GntR family transcriptional regulator [Corynebacterium sp.]|nr:GntR family transcriptional regulator [Corynebacterium sp.]